MSKPFKASDDEIQHFILPEVKGKIIGFDNITHGPQTVEELEALQKRAYEEGLARGYEAARAEIRQRTQRLLETLDFLQAPLQKLDEEVELQLSQLALHIGSQLLQRESRADPDVIRSIIKQALSFLPVSSRNVKVRMNPDDMLLLQQSGVELEQESWQALADHGISRGGCFVESTTAQVDASLETRLKEVFDQLMEHVPEDGSPVPGS